ncbi:hypothetical protein KVR01_012132 [Diaporthe batatas]|uniref:uncharacterized protein n=1 Tax=Diaporthe batatas TaxID=748121 RepID=UPI001D03851E|nr:uncharacterized protein KVR01_012132 [Diaporthe batatas]KAG8157860.1 hypothetical protein KVR01_012132 [Diaporthe batatas]
MATPSHLQATQEDIEHFKQIPWCLKHLEPPNTDLVISKAYTRGRKPKNEDTLFSVTINSPGTLPHFIFFYPRPTDPRALVPEVKALITLGDDLNGHPGISHGGMVAAIFDEVLGYAAPGVRMISGENRGTSGTPGPSYVTAYLNTTYLKPVRTPATVMVVSRLVRTEGRKIWVEGHMEDGEGVKLAKADSLFVETKLKL